MIFACSPRPGGNCDSAAGIALDAALRARARHITEITYLRNYSVAPCTGCQSCSAAAGRCPLQGKDDAQRLFGMLQNAPGLVLIAPIYFYHLPAQLKALIDRGQIFWNLRQKDAQSAQSVQPGKPARKAHVILIAAREKGDLLFSGSLLTLRYWLPLFGFELAEPLCIYGMDERGDLMKNDAARDALASYANAIYANSISANAISG